MEGWRKGSDRTGEEGIKKEEKVWSEESLRATMIGNGGGGGELCAVGFRSSSLPRDRASLPVLVFIPFGRGHDSPSSEASEPQSLYKQEDGGGVEAAKILRSKLPEASAV